MCCPDEDGAGTQDQAHPAGWLRSTGLVTRFPGGRGVQNVSNAPLHCVKPPRPATRRQSVKVQTRSFDQIMARVQAPSLTVEFRLSRCHSAPAVSARGSASAVGAQLSQAGSLTRLVPLRRSWADDIIEQAAARVRARMGSVPLACRAQTEEVQPPSAADDEGRANRRAVIKRRKQEEWKRSTTEWHLRCFAYEGKTLAAWRSG